MSNFLKSAEKALSMRQDYLLSHGFDCYTSKDIANCPKLVNEASEVFNTINEYKVDQGKMEYVKTGWYNKFYNGVIDSYSPISLNNDYCSNRSILSKITIDTKNILHLSGASTNYWIGFDATMIDVNRYNSSVFRDATGSHKLYLTIDKIQNPN